MRKLIFVSLLISLFILPQFCLGIGMMSKPIVIEDVLRGGEVEEILTIYNTEAEPITYEMVGIGDIEGWTSFFSTDNLEEPITKIQIPAKSNINAIARFLVPQDMPNGKYNGKIIVMTIPDDGSNEEGSSVSVRLKVSRDVSIRVTDEEITQFKTTFIPTYDVRKGESLNVRVIYNNQGNVAIKPKLQLKIIREEETIYNAIFPYTENEEAVRAKTKKEISSIMWPSDGQKNGIYFAEIKVLLNGKTMQEHDFRFTVGYETGSFLAALAGLGPNKLGVILIGIGILLMGVFLIRTFVFKKRDWMLLAGFVKSVFS